MGTGQSRQTWPAVSDGRFEGAEVTHARRAARLLDDEAVQLHDFAKRQVADGPAAASGEPAVKFPVLLENPGCGLLEVWLGRRQQVAQGGGGEFLGAYVQPRGHRGELRLEGAGQFNGEAHLRGVGSNGETCVSNCVPGR